LEVNPGLVVGFTDHEAQISGFIDLPMVIREEKKVLTLMVKFVVIDMPISYNGIIDRPSLNAAGIVVLATRACYFISTC